MEPGKKKPASTVVLFSPKANGTLTAPPIGSLSIASFKPWLAGEGV